MDKQNVGEMSKPENSYYNYNYRLDNIHEIMFISILGLYSSWRFCKSRYSKSSIFRNKSRVVGSLMILLCIYLTVVYNYLLLFLNMFFNINKYEFELVGQIKYDYNYRNINLFEVVSIAYTVSKILRISAIFMLLGLWGPCLYSYVNTNNLGFSVFTNSNSKIMISKNIFQTSIVTFSKIYAVLRIPFGILLYYKMKQLSPPSIVFIESIVYSSELYLCIMLLLILRTKHDFISGQKGLDTITLLGLCLGLYAFFTYSVNIISMPFVISIDLLGLKQSLIFSLRTIIDLLLISMFCPLDNQVFDGQELHGIGNPHDYTKSPQLLAYEGVFTDHDDQSKSKILVRYK